ncbi:MAG: hypothetical protein IRY99_04050 [Isosphaeraceae bacterium]|nr:hypothetical protein [Isosphaeraceae bacterium]
MPRIDVGYGGLSWKKVRAVVEAVRSSATGRGRWVVYEEFVSGESEDSDCPEGITPEAPTMSDSYTVLRTDDRCRWLKQHGATGQSRHVLFGGSQQSAPSFTRFGVKASDFIYPVWVHGSVLHVVARLRVWEIIPVADYLLHHLDSPDVGRTRHLHKVQADLIRLHLELEHRIPGAASTKRPWARRAHRSTSTSPPRRGSWSGCDPARSGANGA